MSDDKDETSSKLNEIVGVMKDSANHLVARSQTLAHDPQEQERVSFFQWMLEFTSRMPCQNWRDFITPTISFNFDEVSSLSLSVLSSLLFLGLLAGVGRLGTGNFGRRLSPRARAALMPTIIGLLVRREFR